MLIQKENTKYGYKTRLRYEVKKPTIHVIAKGATLKLRGESDLTVITGNVTIRRMDKRTRVADTLEDKNTYRLPKELEVKVIANTKTVLLEENSTQNHVEDFLNLTVIEEEPSSDDLKYIDEWYHSSTSNYTHYVRYIHNILRMIKTNPDDLNATGES